MAVATVVTSHAEGVETPLPLAGISVPLPRISMWCSATLQASAIIILNDVLKTSIALANSGVVVDDYGCYTFGIMKALDGLISKRLLEDASVFKDYGTYFEKSKDGNFHFLENVGTYNDNPLLKRALEKAYDFYNKNRHTTFHVDRRNLETSRTLYYDEAVNIIKDGLVIINDLCISW